MDEWITANEYDATAIQCWTSMQEYFGVVPCTMMSMLSDKLAPFGLRDGYCRDRRHVRDGVGIGQASALRGLEQ